MNKIEQKYVTFKQAEWLKEKGFNENCLVVIDNNEFELLNKYYSTNSKLIPTACSRPEQHQVVEWLRVNHDVEVYHVTYKETKGKYDCIILSDEFDTEMSAMLLTNSKWFNSPHEAYSAAFDYIINNNLI